MVPSDRSHTTFYSSSIATIYPSVSEIYRDKHCVDTINKKLVAIAMFLEGWKNNFTSFIHSQSSPSLQMS